MARRLLVLGGTGMLGHAAIDVLKPEFDTVASVRDPQHPHARGLGVETVRFDARADEIGDLIDQIRPDAVLNAIGLVKQLPDGQSSAAAIRMNALFPHELAHACTKHKCRLVHVSTDCVFAGSLPAPGRYRESDVPDARDVYGRSKLLGEVAAPHVTLRTSIIGRELGGVTGLMEWFVAQDGTRADGYRQAWFSGFTTRALSRLIATVLLEHPSLVGLWHVAAEPIDKYTLLLRMREALGIECDVTPRDEPVINRALDPTRFEKTTGYRPPTWNEMLEEYTARR
ncbi:MAG: SDR family oxidoreductase [Solirubrobacteraceae bacterium]